MFKKYPRIGEVTKLRIPTKKICKICGAPAIAMVEIRNSCFRGDDDVESRCKEHLMVIKPEAAKRQKGAGNETPRITKNRSSRRRAPRTAEIHGRRVDDFGDDQERA